jgi:hypothetical protein
MQIGMMSSIKSYFIKGFTPYALPSVPGEGAGFAKNAGIS